MAKAKGYEEEHGREEYARETIGAVRDVALDAQPSGDAGRETRALIETAAAEAAEED